MIWAAISKINAKHTVPIKLKQSQRKPPKLHERASCVKKIKPLLPSAERGYSSRKPMPPPQGACQPRRCHPHLEQMR
jgi:hypothetical protein